MCVCDTVCVGELEFGQDVTGTQTPVSLLTTDQCVAVLFTCVSGCVCVCVCVYECTILNSTVLVILVYLYLGVAQTMKFLTIGKIVHTCIIIIPHALRSLGIM